MPNRTRRQEVILTLISDKAKPIRNQGELIKELEARGVLMTQSTLSRELKALGIAKTPDSGGGYRYTSGELSGRGPLSPLVAFVRTIERAKNLVVVTTPPGNAQGVAHGLDEVAWTEVMGTIAGDDTILLICRTDKDGAEVERRLKALTRR
jgi:transcriptional regulator of arginine metabolism